MTHSHVSSCDGDQPVASSSPNVVKSSDVSYVSSELHEKKVTAGFKKIRSSTTLGVKKKLLVMLAIIMVVASHFIPRQKKYVNKREVSMY